MNFGTLAVSATAGTVVLDYAGSLIVDNILCDKGLSGSSTALSGGSLVLKVKGILNVPANSVAGTYSNATNLKVTVNYN